MTEENSATQNDTNETLEISLVPDGTIPSKRIYANFVAINQSAYDFSLRFCDASPIHDIEKTRQNNGVHPAPVVAEIALPFDVIPGLIKALQNQYNRRLEIVQKNPKVEDSE